MTLAARPVPVLLAAIAGGAAVVSLAMLLAEPLGSALADWPPAWQEAVFAVILYGALALVATLGRVLARTGEQHRSPILPWLTLGAVIGLGGLLLTTAMASLAQTVTPGTAAAAGGTLALGSIIVLGQSASEELFFRGWLQPVLLRAWGPVAAIGVTALAFAALHVAGGARTPLTLVNLVLGGALFGLLAWRSGGLAAPIAAHAGWNWAESILLGLDPNPGVGGFGAVLDLDLVGLGAWGGSDEGLNASIAMTFVLAAIILPLAAELSRSSAPGSRRSGPAPA